jgi:hypothetical protein
MMEGEEDWRIVTVLCVMAVIVIIALVHMIITGGSGLI